MRIKPFISIIFPIKLPDLNFRKTIYSIQNQNFTNFEVIILKSGDFDFQQKIIIQKITFSYRIINENGNGVYSAMNLGIEKSIGEYLYFIGSGDELFRFDSLLCVSNILQNKDVDILMCNVITNNILYPGLDFNLEKIYHGAMCCHQGIFMKRNWFINLNGFDVKYLIASDFDLILRAIKNGASTIFVNLCVARYLGGGISDKNSSISNKTIILMKSGFFFNSFKFLFIELLAKYYRKYLKMNFNLLV